MSSRVRLRRPPRLVVRTLAVSFMTVVVLLGAVFAMLLLHTREVVRHSVIENLEDGQQQLALVEQQRRHEASLQAVVLTETPTLKAALDTYLADNPLRPEAGGAEQALVTVEREVSKLASVLGSQAVAVVDTDHRVLASAGPAAAAWRRGRHLALGRVLARDDAFELVIALDDQRFRVTGAPILLGDVEIGALLIGTRVDDRYAREIADILRTNIAVVMEDRVIASTLDAAANGAFERAFAEGLEDAGSLVLAGEPFAYRRLHQLGPASFYAIGSIAEATARISRAAIPKVAAIGAGAFLLSALASFWLARTTTDPINQLSRELAEMAQSRTPARPLTTTGTSAEIDGLVGTFNELMAALSEARAETEAAYVGAIRALATALDARDAYTAGHSERVSTLSVAIGRKMGLQDRDLDVLRLGALLHDIGKIGISDAILCKPAPLTMDEFRVIQTHPAVGAQILKSIAILAPHIPIVELHHEQPDGAGYPHGLRGPDIPLLAHIVHVADAFDAMTTKRAYREGLSQADAMTELWQHAGTQFDAEVVKAFAEALPAALTEWRTAERRTGNVIQFERQRLWA
jgi:putative nucleotidyltransferase with HDIG domain